MNYKPLIKVSDQNSSSQDHTKTIDDLLAELESSIEIGLESKQIKNRYDEYGYNELEKEEKESIWDKIKEQFSDLLVRILLLAAVISFLISLTDDRNDEYSVPAWVEPLVIFIILILNAAVGIYQDFDAEKALEALKELQSTEALVLRDGKWIVIPSREVVPGDLIEVHQGDIIPADARIVQIKSESLRVEEGILTGESQAVLKTSDVLTDPDLPMAERKNLLYSGTLVSSGSAIGLVFATGMNTEIGKIQKSLADTEEEKTPLQLRLDEFGESLAKIIGIICVLCWLINFKNFSDPVHGGFVRGCLYYFKIAVALAVAAIPEGLPAVITTCLALGTRRMAKENAIVRKLTTVETLGCTTIICSDKTGTLTTNEMVVKEVLLFEDSPFDTTHFKVTGESYQPTGEIIGLHKDEYSRLKSLKLLSEAIFLNNEAKLIKKDGKIERVGLATEAALKVFVEKLAKYNTDATVDSIDGEFYGNSITKQYHKLQTLEFTAERISMSTLCKNLTTGKNILFIKGAPESLLTENVKYLSKTGEVCKLNLDSKTKLLAKIQELGSKGYRNLAVSYKEDCGILKDYDGPNHPGHMHLLDPNNYAKFEEDSILLGIIAIQDPPRVGVADAIRRCKKAGISVIMITGDNKNTAQSIGKEINIIDERAFSKSSFTGSEFETFSEIRQDQIMMDSIKEYGGLIFSRTEPRHKKMLVRCLSNLNQIVAMTGDGVNDAPALKQAHVGIAMGITGTAVAKEASDIVLADDNFETIVKAVEEGRAIFANMKAFIRYMISSNIGEVVSIFLSSLLGIPDAFNSTQLLWVNLVTDGLPATALSFNPSDPFIMERPPRKHDEPIVTPWVFTRYMVIGVYVGLATVGIFIYWYLFYDWAGDGHDLISYSQLSSWGQCSNWKDFEIKNFGPYLNFHSKPCLYFTIGKQTASTLSLTVLVVIEMFNSLNALSEDSSLLTIGIFSNLYLIGAIAISIILHCAILYIPFLTKIFGTVPLSKNDWILVILFSFPVIIIDEILKIISRHRNNKLRLSGKKVW